MSRRAPLLAAAALALVGVAAALAGRLLPPSPEALAARDRRLVRATARALEEDAARLARVAARLRADAALGEVIEGGGAEVRPARSFEILRAALPGPPGWGAVFFERSGRAVAWGGDAGDVESAVDLSREGLVATFHVTRFRLAYVLPWTAFGERRGTLVVSRRYPTGVLSPDLAEMLSIPGGPTRLRVLASGASRLGSLLALSVSAPSPEASADDLARRRARPFAILAAAALVAAGLFATALPVGLTAARLVLLLGAPRASGGPWEILFPGSGLELVATPADLLLTGLLAAALLRSLLAWRPTAPRPLARALLGAALACLPWLLARSVAVTRPDLFDDLRLVPESFGLFLVRVGALALCAAAMGAAARLLPGASGRRARLEGIAGMVLLLVGLTEGNAPGAAVAAVTGSVLLAAWLAPRVASWGTDLLVRTETSVFLAGATCLAAAAGLASGNEARLDAAIASEESTASRAVDWQERAAAWAGVVARTPGSWQPAGSETVFSDLARALWVRGAAPGFPGLGDVLTIRNASGDVVSSFGVTRPGASVRAGVLAVAIPVRGLHGQFTHLPDPEEGERDPLLSAVVERDVPDQVAVERLSFDAAGRSRMRGERSELPPELLHKARRRGSAHGTVSFGAGPRRVWIRKDDAGFAGLSASSQSPTTLLGVALAATETALLPLAAVLLLSLPPTFKRLGAGLRFTGTFRARLVALVFLFGALPLAGSIVVVRLALERHATDEISRRAHALLSEARRALAANASPDEADLSRVAQVIGSDLFLYRDGRLAYASRALPVAAEVARDRLSARVASELAEGRAEALAPARRVGGTPLRVVEAAQPVGRGEEALAVVLGEDEAGRVAVDGLVLFTVAVALFAFGLGGREALSLSRPLDAVIASAERLGAGAPAETLERPAMADVRRLVDAFELMARRVRERTEMLAREREAAVGLLANLTAAVILFRERDGRVLLANPAADQLLPGRDLGSRLSPLRPLAEALEEARSRPRPYETRLSLALAGRERLVRIVVASLPPEEDESRALLLVEDLTDFVRAEHLSAWVDAARAIAHDVKNPLTPMRLAAERLLRRSSRGDAPSVETLEGAALSILRQVEILTDRIGRLSRFSDPASLERLSIPRDEVARVLLEIAADYGGGAVSVRAACGPDLPPVTADRALLRDALANFVVNALEAMAERPGEVVLSAERGALSGGEPGVRFSCADDGPGVLPELLPRLFEPAFTTKSRGSGMGLAATRRAVERLGGKVFAGPRTGGGLVVGFVLPTASPISSIS